MTTLGTKLPRLADPSRYDTKFHFSDTTVLPLLNLASVVVFSLLALVLIPQDTTSDAAMQLSAACLSIGLLLGPTVAVIRQPMSIVRPENLLLLGIVYWVLLEPLLGHTTVSLIRRGVLVETFVVVASFAVAACIGVMFLRVSAPVRVMQLASIRPSNNALIAITVLCFVLGTTKNWLACGVNAACYVDAFQVHRFSAAWTGHGKLGGAHSFVAHTTYFGYLLPALTVLVRHLRRRTDLVVFFCIIMTLIFLLFLARDGGRRNVGMIVGAGGILWLLISQKSGHRKLFVTVFGIAALLVTMHLMLAFRTTGLAGVLQPGAAKAALSKDGGRVDKNFRNLAWTVDLVPDRYPYAGSQQLVYVLVRPVPRFFWPGKPVDGGFTLESTVGGTRGTYTESVIGDLYIISGIWSVIAGGLIFGLFAALVANVLHSAKHVMQKVLFAFGCLWVFVGLRSMHELVLGFYPILVLLGGFWMYRQFPQGRRAYALAPNGKNGEML